MNVSVKRKALENFVKTILFEREDVRYGTFDRPIGDAGAPSENDDFDSTVPEEVPVHPSKMMATQLADESPPVEDDDYIPANSEELSRAAAVLSKLVPDGQVEKFYHEIQRLLDSVVDDENYPGEHDGDDENIATPVDAEKEVQEEAIRRAIRRTIDEAYGHQTDWGEISLGNHNPEDEEDEWNQEDYEQPEPEKDGMSLKQLSQMAADPDSSFSTHGPKMSGEGGLRQMMQRVLKRAGWTSETIPKADKKEMADFALDEYLRVDRELFAKDPASHDPDDDYYDSEDVEQYDPKAAGKDVKKLDQEDDAEQKELKKIIKGSLGFRQFVADNFLIPAYKMAKKSSIDAVTAEFEKEGIPQKARQTILNQVIGEVDKNMGLINKKLASTGASDDVIKKVKSGFPSWSKLFVKGMEDAGKSAKDYTIDRWNKLGKSRQHKAFKSSEENLQAYEDASAKGLF
tara:strand:+ start:3491 stop:4864 length:1374 start_codon:yes stop_codon:yes gene_type:complete